MTLDQLRIFVAVAEREHITRAAEALHLVPSAVSQAVSLLEAGFGIALFDRVGRRIALTAAGRAFLPEARAVLLRADAARNHLAELAGLEHGTLCIHASQTIAGYWLPSRLRAFRDLYPRITLQVLIGNSDAVARSVLDGSVDLGLVEGDVAGADLDVVVVAQDQLVLVVAPDHPWASCLSITAGMLSGVDWVLREAGSGTRSAFEAALLSLGVAASSLAVVLELPSNETVRGAVEAGLGASALSASVAASGIEAGLLHAVPFPLPPRAFSAVRHRQRSLSRTAEAFLASLEKPG